MGQSKTDGAIGFKSANQAVENQQPTVHNCKTCTETPGFCDGHFSSSCRRGHTTFAHKQERLRIAQTGNASYAGW